MGPEQRAPAPHRIGRTPSPDMPLPPLPRKGGQEALGRLEAGARSRVPPPLSGELAPPAAETTKPLAWPSAESVTQRKPAGLKQAVSLASIAQQLQRRPSAMGVRHASSSSAQRHASSSSAQQQPAELRQSAMGLRHASSSSGTSTPHEQPAELRQSASASSIRPPQRRPSNLGLRQSSAPSSADKQPARRPSHANVSGGTALSGGSHQRTATLSKGPCRGCGEHIFGKSISSSDGRLTGRYHKECFACQTCHSPFQSAEFYVMDNVPLCHRHYHVLNHSLCGVCDRGIEGLCVETARRERFHPACFTCSVSALPVVDPARLKLTRLAQQQCHGALGDDYYEINGRPICDHHAQRHLRRQQERQLAERRPAPAAARQHRHDGGYNAASLAPPAPRVERRRSRMIFMPNALDPEPPAPRNRYPAVI